MLHSWCLVSGGFQVKVMSFPTWGKKHGRLYESLSFVSCVETRKAHKKLILQL